MSMSVSLKLDTQKTNIDHNNRIEKEQGNHIDSKRSHLNKYLVQEDLKKIYEREFGEALKKFNDKQKRSDRKIKDYLKHIKSGKKTRSQQEMIIQIGDKDDFGNLDNWDLANDVLEKWFNDFEKRNPNLKIYNAVIHNDEASPHLHLNFVPVAGEYKRGLEKQVSFNRAVLQQDKDMWSEYQNLQKRIKLFKEEQKKKGSKKRYPYKDWEKQLDRPFEIWRDQEVSLLTELLKEHGIERKIVGTNEYKDMNDYKEKKNLEREVQNLIKKRDEITLEVDSEIDKVESFMTEEKENDGDFQSIDTSKIEQMSIPVVNFRKSLSRKRIADEEEVNELIDYTNRLKGRTSDLANKHDELTLSSKRLLKTLKNERKGRERLIKDRMSVERQKWAEERSDHEEQVGSMLSVLEEIESENTALKQENSVLLRWKDKAISFMEKVNVYDKFKKMFQKRNRSTTNEMER